MYSVCSKPKVTQIPEKITEYIGYEADPQKEKLRFYLRDDQGNFLKTLAALNNHVTSKNETLLFAMNGGMYQKDGMPQGLYIEQRKIIKPIELDTGYGNFYLKPNGVFIIDTNNIASILVSENLTTTSHISYATQSGPMLVVEGIINNKFAKDSKNLNIRNGVGILPNGNPIFAMSKQEVTLYAFAQYFIEKGCKQALYLDGAVSKTYAPDQNWVQTDGDFGVMIGISK
jgi:uncharacterized protein YigE (DUF2233 family)